MSNLNHIILAARGKASQADCCRLGQRPVILIVKLLLYQNEECEMVDDFPTCFVISSSRGFTMYCRAPLA
jgi:hypothetical protein